MNQPRWISLLFCSLLAVLSFGCRKAETPTIESKSEVKSTNPDGSKITTETEQKQVGSTMEVKTETDAPGKQGDTRSETVVGTVTDYAPGKTITVLTGDGTKHTYDLSKKETVADIDRRVTVGSKVKLDTTKESSGYRSLRVVPVTGS